jgi:NADH-quinone oxidoreductase subunit L
MTFFGELKLGSVDVGEEAHSASAPAQAAHSAASHAHGHADDQSHGHGGVHESPWIMIAPLMVLALLSIVGGWVGIPASMGGHNEIGSFLRPVMTASVTNQVRQLSPSESAQLETERGGERNEELLLAGTSVLVALIGFYFAWLLYYKSPGLPDKITAKIHGIYLLVLHKYYVDEGYGQLIVKPLLALSTVVFWRGIDQGVIDGLVNGAGSASKGIGGELRRIQSGNIRSYAAWVAIGGAAVIAYMIWLGVAK